MFADKRTMNYFCTMIEMEKPLIAIITQNTATGIGLRSLIASYMPGCEIQLFNDNESFIAENRGQFFHYFVSLRNYLAQAHYYLEACRKTIVLIHGNDLVSIPREIHTLNICLPEKILVKNIIQLAEHSHQKISHSAALQMARARKEHLQLTDRETEVLRYVVSGMKNREIADHLNVTLATIITHPKNIVSKLKTKSVSGLTIYAVAHGIIQVEDI